MKLFLTSTLFLLPCLTALRRSPAVPHSGLLHDPFHPFNHPDDGERAMAFTPDVMTEEEMAAFDEYSKLVCIHMLVMSG